MKNILEDTKDTASVDVGSNDEDNKQYEEEVSYVYRLSLKLFQ